MGRQRMRLLLKGDLHHFGPWPRFLRPARPFSEAGGPADTNITRAQHRRCGVFDVVCFANELAPLDFLRRGLDAGAFWCKSRRPRYFRAESLAR